MIPGIVKIKVNQDKNVTFVDPSGDLTHPNDLSDDVHANAQGYSKMADAWFAAIVRKTA